MYSKIQTLKGRGFKQRKVPRMLEFIVIPSRNIGI